MKVNRFINNIILVFFVFSILLIGLIDFLPFKFTEWCVGCGGKFEKFIYSLSLAYIASCIFYFVVVYLKEKNDRRRKREEFHTHISLYLNKYHEQLKNLLSFKEDIIIKTEIRKPYKLSLENLIYIFEPAPQFSFYTRYSDDETRSFLQNRTKRYRNYFFALKILLGYIKLNYHLLDYYEDNEFYELFHLFIILNEEENFEEELDQRSNTKQENNDHYLFEKDIEHIKEFTGRIKDEPEFAYPLELNSKEYLDLYYRFLHQLESNINLLRSYKRMID